MASGYGHKSVVQLLLDKGAKVESADKDGQTPLHAPNTSSGFTELVVGLL